MKTCATCKHWKKDVARAPNAYEADETGIERVGYLCDADGKQLTSDEAYNDVYEYRHYADMATCGTILHVNDAHLGAKAVVKDASDYAGRLLTTAEFGCVLHED